DAKAVARFDAALLAADDDEEASDAAMRLRWARIQHAQLLERLERWPQAVVEFRHLYEEERAVAEAAEEEESDSASASVSDSGSDSETETESESETETETESEPESGSVDWEAGGGGGLERVFARLIQLGRVDLAYVVLDDLGGELADDRTRATYAIYDPGDGLPQIMVEHWDGHARAKLDPTKLS